MRVHSENYFNQSINQLQKQNHYWQMDLLQNYWFT